MALITFMSDFGHEDHYVAAVKARILAINPELKIIDISHEISSFDITHGAFVLRSAYRGFPAGTIHLSAVNSIYRYPARYIALQLEDHFFIGPDNGLFSLISDKEPSMIAELPAGDDSSVVFPAREILARPAAMLAGGTPFKEIGKASKDYYRLLGRQLKATKKQISGNVIRVDHFGNLITNIEKKTFDLIRKERPFSIKFGKETLNKIHKSYASAEPGECFVVFNSLGYLEIGINQGNAAELLGMEYDSPVQINFPDNA